MFNFRIITCADGTQVIDETLKTPYESLTWEQRIEYNNVEDMLYCMKREAQKQKKNVHNFISNFINLFKK